MQNRAKKFTEGSRFYLFLEFTKINYIYFIYRQCAYIIYTGIPIVIFLIWIEIALQ